MGESKLDLLQVTLEIMVLQTLGAMGSLQGYGIGRRIEQVSGNEVLRNQGTIYAIAAARMDRRRVGTSDNKIAKRSSTPLRRPAGNSWRKMPRTASGWPE